MTSSSLLRRQAIALALGSFLATSNSPVHADNIQLPPADDTAQELQLFADALKIMREQYVTPVDQKKLIQVALKAMATSLDEHSNYMDPTSYNDFSDQAKGQFSGVGLVVAVENDTVKVLSPVDGSPAARAGIAANDLIVEVDGVSTKGQTLKDVVSKIRGPIGTDVTLKIARGSAAPFTVPLKRETINNKSVFSRAIGDDGYIRITGFSQNTGKEMRQVVAELKDKMPNMKGLVLDLRNNGGGFVNAAVEVASVFLDGGEVVSQRGRNSADDVHLDVQAPDDQLHDVNLVVLVNSGTASAAEIVAGALRDHKRATVIGLTSWGKGVVQTIFPLHAGKDGALSVTTSRYYTPSGQSIQKIGIVPDLQVARSKIEVQDILSGPLQFSEATLKKALDNDAGAVRQPPKNVEIPDDVIAADVVKDGKKTLRPLFASSVLSDDDIAHDFQLQRALDVLHYGGIAQAQAQKPAAIFQPEKASR